LKAGTNFLHGKRPVDNGLQTIGRYRPNHVLLICSAADGDPADTNLIRKTVPGSTLRRNYSQTPMMAICPPVLQAVIDCVQCAGSAHLNHMIDTASVGQILCLPTPRFSEVNGW